MQCGGKKSKRDLFDSQPLKPFHFSHFTQAATRPDMPLADIMVRARLFLL